jgi:hypothetical protein
VLSTVLTGGCRPCPISRKERPAEQDSTNGTGHGRVDTHLDLQVAAVLDHTGRLLGTQGFPASTRGSVALVTWAERFGPVERIGVEGTGTYGAGLARFVRAYVWRPSR